MSHSDNVIVINDTTTQNTVVVNDNPILQTISVQEGGVSVYSVNGRVGYVTLTKTDVGLDQVDNTSDLNKPLSNAELSALLLKADLSAFNLLNNFILTKYGTWDNTTIEVNNFSPHWNSVYTTVNILSSDWQTAYTNVGILSSDLNSVYSDVNQLSAKWNLAYSGVNSVSANLNTFFSILSSLSSIGSQTLSFNISSNNLTISNGNTVSLSSLSFNNVRPSTSYLTIQQFALSNPTYLNKGNTVTLYNNRVYILAGTNPSNPSHYLQLNANPHTPIYVEIPLSAGNQMLVDSFYLGDFKASKYTLQVETSYDNSIYYSELNVVGSVGDGVSVVSEYGQISTGLSVFYSTDISANILNLYVNYSDDNIPSHKFFIRGLRTNHYQI